MKRLFLLALLSVLALPPALRAQQPAFPPYSIFNTQIRFVHIEPVLTVGIGYESIVIDTLVKYRTTDMLPSPNRFHPGVCVWVTPELYWREAVFGQMLWHTS